MQETISLASTLTIHLYIVISTCHTTTKRAFTTRVYHHTRQTSRVYLHEIRRRAYTVHILKQLVITFTRQTVSDVTTHTIPEILSASPARSQRMSR